MGFDTVSRPVKTWHTKAYERIDPRQTGFDGKGKTLVITAGATGIGFSITKSFADAGVSRVVILSRSPGPQEKAKSALKSSHPSLEVITRQVSITDYEKTRSILEEIGGIDVLVLSATAVEPVFGGKSIDVAVSGMQAIFDTNVVAAFNLVQTYSKLPAPAGGRKTIINVSSLASHMVLPGQVGYGPSKAAVTQVFQHLAAELGPSEVTMLSFHPGAICTETVMELGIQDHFDWDDINLPGHFAVWLASPEASFLHGRMVWTNWDVDELVGLKEKVEKDPTFLTIGLLQ